MQLIKHSFINDFIRICIIFIFLMSMLPFSAQAEERPQHIKVELVQEEESIQASRPFWVALRLNLEKEWHVYWKNPGDAGIPLKIEWKLPKGFTAGPIQWPFPERFTVAEMVGFGYEGEAVFLCEITPPSFIDDGFDGELQASVKWLVCSALSCQPGSGTATLPLKVSKNLPLKTMVLANLFETARSKIPRKDIKIKAIYREESIQLEIEKSEDAKKQVIECAYFFPEDKNAIDYSLEPVVYPRMKADSPDIVSLKKSDEEGRLEDLKGVLVLKSLKGNLQSILAIDVHGPIEQENNTSSQLLSKTKFSRTDALNGAVFQGGLGLAIIFAFLGGMILNLMPCVLPVMSFKVMSFVKMAGKNRSLTLRHGLFFSLGVVLSFWVLASAMLILRAYGQSVGWGFQLQEPLFVVFLASILFLFALSLFGVFEMGMSVSSWAGQTEADKTHTSSGYTGSFLSGILATAVATPCTGPFLGSAVGFAVTLPAFQSLLIFTFLALGMCFPYLLLAAFPQFLRFLPKPGSWMETFKQITGFIMLATVLWLLWVFSAQTDAFSLICLLGGFFFFSIGAWIFGKGGSPLQSKKTRLLAYAFAVFFVFIGIEAILVPRNSWDSIDVDSKSNSSAARWEGWENFSPERVEELRSQGKPVLIDFTAKWCLICQANHLVLSSEDVMKQMDASGVVKMKADWTKSDPVITRELSKFGRSSVPLYVLYGGDENAEPVILPQVLTPDVIAEHLEKAISSEEIAMR